MSELIVIGYDTPETAETARTDLLGMAKEYLVDVADAVVATTNHKGDIKLSQMVNLWTVGGAGGAFWGLLVGLLFLHPLIGIIGGAAAGSLAGAMSDYGINDDFMKQVSSILQPGQAALFIMARNHASDRVISQLSSHGGRVIRTNLDTSQEQKLRAAFAKAHEEVGKTQAAA